MEGKFLQKKTNIWLALCILCGIFLIVLYFFIQMEDAEATGEVSILLGLGILFGAFAIPSLLLNHGAYFRIEENTIRAKYHWFGKLACSIQEVAFVLPQLNTLTILLKNGKRHTIMGVENSWALAAAIRRQSFRPETEDHASLREQLTRAQDARKKDLWLVLGNTALLFLNIFIAVLLTGGRELQEFSRLDWILFSAMGIVELLTLIGLFYVAQRCGKQLLPLEQLKYRLQGAIIAAHPLPSNNIVSVYTNDDHSVRVVVCGFPRDPSVYYCVQVIYGDLGLETVHTSKVYESVEDLPRDDFSALIDITAHFLLQ